MVRLRRANKKIRPGGLSAARRVRNGVRAEIYPFIVIDTHTETVMDYDADLTDRPGVLW